MPVCVWGGWLLDGLTVKNPLANTGATGDRGSILGLGRSSGRGNGNPLQYTMDRGAWWAAVHRITKNQTQLSEHTHPVK